MGWLIIENPTLHFIMRALSSTSVAELWGRGRHVSATPPNCKIPLNKDVASWFTWNCGLKSSAAHGVFLASGFYPLMCHWAVSGDLSSQFLSTRTLPGNYSYRVLFYSIFLIKIQFQFKAVTKYLVLMLRFLSQFEVLAPNSTLQSSASQDPGKPQITLRVFLV